MDLVTQLEYARRDAEARAANCAHYKARAIDLQEQVEAQAAEIERLSSTAGAARVLLSKADSGELADLHHAVMDMIGVAAGHDDEGKVIDGVLDGLRALAEKGGA